jgi:hypothetical protein
VPHGAIGSTSDFDSEGSTFESWWGIQIRRGGRARFNAPVLKTDVLKGTVGSNPTLSAIIKSAKEKKLGTFFILGLDNFMKLG